MFMLHVSVQTDALKGDIQDTDDDLPVNKPAKGGKGALSARTKKAPEVIEL